MRALTIALLVLASPALSDELSDKRMQLETIEANLKAIDVEEREQSTHLQQAKQEEARLKDTADLLRGAGARHKAESDKWDADSAAIKSKWQDYRTRWAPLNERIKAYNSNCPSGTVPKEVYQRCRPEWEAIQGPQRTRNAEREGLDREQTALNERAKTWNQMNNGLKARWKDLSDATLANATKQKAANARLDELRTRQAALRIARSQLVAQLTQLNEECKRLLQSGSAEELKLKCGNVQFDRADPSLPPLGERPAIGTRITPNQ
jgi:chromosome segregation ATPase